MKEFNKILLFIIFWGLITCVVFLIYYARNHALEGNGHGIRQNKDGDRAKKIMNTDIRFTDSFYGHMTGYQAYLYMKNS